MEKYTKEQLAELAKGVFVDDKTSPSIYADENGTFRNNVQYDALPEKSMDEKRGKDSFPFEFKNPNVKEVSNAGEGSVILIDGETIPVGELKDYLSKVLKSSNEAKKNLDEANESKDQLQAQLDAANAEITRLNGLKGVTATKELQSQLDAANQAIAELKAKYETAPAQ